MSLLRSVIREALAESFDRYGEIDPVHMDRAADAIGLAVVRRFYFWERPDLTASASSIHPMEDPYKAHREASDARSEGSAGG